MFSLNNNINQRHRKKFQNKTIMERRIRNPKRAIVSKTTLNLKNTRNLASKKSGHIRSNSLVSDKKAKENLIKNNIVSEKPFFNILIRNCYRPKSFEKCISTIGNQNYDKSHIRVICSYDDVRCLDYLNKYKKYLNMEIIKVSVNSTEKYKFNLYLNSLIEHVKKGWIIYLDDDDGFYSRNALNVISNNILQKNCVYFWKVKLGTSIVYPKDINNLVPGGISGIGFCFHSSYKYESKWEPYKGGDYNFITKLLKNVKLNRKFIDNILTQNINNMIGFKGLKEEYILNDFLKDTNIEQIYISDYIVNNDIILKYLNLKKYNDVKQPALFFGVFGRKDVNTIKNHRGPINIMFYGKDVENFKYVKSTFVKYLSVSDEIYNKLEKNNIFSIKLQPIIN